MSLFSAFLSVLHFLYLLSLLFFKFCLHFSLFFVLSSTYTFYYYLSFFSAAAFLLPCIICTYIAEEMWWYKVTTVSYVILLDTDIWLVWYDEKQIVCWLAQFCVHGPERFKACCSVMTMGVAATRSPRLDSVDSQIRVWRQQRTLQDLLPYAGESGNHRALLSLLICRYDYLICVRKGLIGLLLHKFTNKQPLRANKLSDEQSIGISELFCDVTSCSLVDM